MGINLASYVGATSVRRMVLGDDDVQPSPAQLAQMQALVHDAMASEPAVPLPTLAPRSWGWPVATLALALAVVSTALWQRDANLPRATSAVSAPIARAAPRSAAAAAGAGTHSELITEPVPFGEDPLGGARLERIGQLLDRLAGQQYHGVVEIKSFAGRFCLVGSAADGYSLAPDETLFAKCDAVGNPRDGAQPAQHLSLPFANLLSDIRHQTQGALDVQVSSGDAAATAVPYPQISPGLAAGEWNRAGSANNRIEIRLR